MPSGIYDRMHVNANVDTRKFLRMERRIISGEPGPPRPKPEQKHRPAEDRKGAYHVKPGVAEAVLEKLLKTFARGAVVTRIDVQRASGYNQTHAYNLMHEIHRLPGGWPFAPVPRFRKGRSNA